VEWDDKYSVKIPLIDSQHKELIAHTNRLYQGCLNGTEEEKKTFFLDTVQSVEDYVKFHFSAEEKMLENVRYPYRVKHKRQHEEFVQQMCQEVKDYEKGKKFVPNAFVRFLRDWILSHIAMEDTKYARYIFDLKKTGNLSSQLKENS
jgi:hemerythrin